MNVRHLSSREWVLIIFHINECKRFSSNDLKNSHIPTETTANVYTFAAFLCVILTKDIRKWSSSSAKIFEISIFIYSSWIFM